MPTAELIGYSRESVIAEKLETVARLGLLNSRIKDFYDIWLLLITIDLASVSVLNYKGKFSNLEIINERAHLDGLENNSLL